MEEKITEWNNTVKTGANARRGDRTTKVEKARRGAFVLYPARFFGVEKVLGEKKTEAQRNTACASWPAHRTVMSQTISNNNDSCASDATDGQPNTLYQACVSLQPRSEV